MKKIKFDDLSYNWYFISIILLSSILLSIGYFELIAFENPKSYKYFTASGHFIQIILLGRMFWFKNYVQWNKKGIGIRIKTFIGKSIAFDDIRNTKIEGKILTIYKYNGKSYDFDIKEIEESDVKKLYDIINQYSRFPKFLNN
ncbi:hypothetical protein P872_07480 [Rhodonellum psychrophilum GCM71 = DSM 17998]|uniref:Uncharacterized protein n=2 Tax=Rhodonellum TaxID=336827 RepID=U5BVU7_9BACT|nr:MULTISPECIES: hypothetical protein [Rhodonellum]ERM81988.1 hypothetical protein P872_07480 [Rhodonellum psychrophilum GCM71 = DSM 17998]SDZ31828.1 hypothetical protein SAMN05444412_11040 [Rhodonellum ikkaensis]